MDDSAVNLSVAALWAHGASQVNIVCFVRAAQTPHVGLFSIKSRNEQFLSQPETHFSTQTSAAAADLCNLEIPAVLQVTFHLSLWLNFLI